MIEFLRRFVGMDAVITAKQIHIVELTAQLCEARAMIQSKDEEIRRLTDLMLTEHGVILRENETRATPTEKPQPIGRRPAWSTVKKRFEDADAKMARQLAKDQVDEMSKYWKDKNSKAESEGVA